MKLVLSPFFRAGLLKVELDALNTRAKKVKHGYLIGVAPAASGPYTVRLATPGGNFEVRRTSSLAYDLAQTGLGILEDANELVGLPDLDERLIGSEYAPRVKP